MKKLLSFLLLSSTSCLAHGFGIAAGINDSLIKLGIILFLHTLIHAILIFCFFKFFKKNTSPSIHSLGNLSILTTLLWSSLFVIFIIIDVLVRIEFLTRYMLFLTVILSIVGSIPLYNWFFPAMNKKSLMALITFTYLLNPVHWWVVLTLFGWRVF